MSKYHLPEFLGNNYIALKPAIKKRLNDFKKIQADDYFYELCYCICTPQSKAKNAFQVVNKLRHNDFFNQKFDPVDFLRDSKHYIRFHNQKSIRLLKAIDIFGQVEKVINSDITAFEKRENITKMVNGFGLKESSHFLRNIGFENLAILDRHVLKHLVYCNVFKDIPKVASQNQYYFVEKEFKKFAKKINIPIDELDLLFWSYETGEILK